MKKSILLCALFIYGAEPLFAATTTEKILETEVHQYMQHYQSKEHFTGMGVSVFIPVKKGEPKGDIFSYFAGLMQVPPPKKPIEANSLFEIGSITKSFTSVLLLQLEGEGKLSLDDPIGKWLPQYKKWSKVTIRHLLNMTSGIPSYSKDDAFDKLLIKDPKAFWTNLGLLNYASPQKEIANAQNAGFDYSNSNYILSALIIEKVTGKPFHEALEERILKPLQLNSTFYPPGLSKEVIEKEISPRMVIGYDYDEKTKKLINYANNDLSWAGAAGAIVANTEDVVHYVQGLYQGSLFSPNYREKALKALTSVVSMKTGKPIPTVDKAHSKGFGLGIGYYYSKDLHDRFFVYEGSTLGFRVFYLYSPCNQVIVASAVNSKGGEGNPQSKQGDNIMNFTLSLYKTLLQKEPGLVCKN